MAIWRKSATSGCIKANLSGKLLVQSSVALYSIIILALACLHSHWHLQLKWQEPLPQSLMGPFHRFYCTFQIVSSFFQLREADILIFIASSHVYAFIRHVPIRKYFQLRRAATLVSVISSNSATLTFCISCELHFHFHFAFISLAADVFIYYQLFLIVLNFRVKVSCPYISKSFADYVNKFLHSFFLRCVGTNQIGEWKLHLTL